MPKTDLGILLGKLLPPEPALSARTPAGRPTEAAASPAASSSTATAESSSEPLYLSLVRKDTRIRGDQLEALTAHARRLNRAKRGGARITENTLVRIAVDLLLERIDRAAGDDEAALRKSLQ